MTPAPRLVLVVDDDVDIRDALIDVLEEDGFRAVGASNGAEALDRLHAGLRPDLILLDLMMPVMDGWEFLRRRRGDPEANTIPVVVLSAAGKSLRPHVRSLGADEFLEKPVEAEDLLDAVSRNN